MSEEIANVWVFRLLMVAICVCIVLAAAAGAWPEQLIIRVCLCSVLLLLVALLWQRLLPFWTLTPPEKPPLEQAEVVIEAPEKSLAPLPSSLPTRS